MEVDREKAIEARAYQIWQDAGQPQGMHDEHWRQAEQEIDGATGSASSDLQESDLDEKPTGDITPAPQQDAREEIPKRSKR